MMKNVVFVGLSLLLGLWPVGGANADARDDALVGVLRCSGMSDTVQRLACYDSAAVRVPGVLSAPVAPVTSVVPAAAPGAPTPRKPKSGGFFSRILGLDNRRPPQTTVAQFGSESIANGGATAFPRSVAGDAVDRIAARLTAYEFADGYMTVTLDNGQMWRQTPDSAPLGHLTKPARAYSAVIGRGSDNYAMKLDGLAGTVPVRRIR
jgi:hypothetical protein